MDPLSLSPVYGTRDPPISPTLSKTLSSDSSMIGDLDTAAFSNTSSEPVPSRDMIMPEVELIPVGSCETVSAMNILLAIILIVLVTVLLVIMTKRWEEWRRDQDDNRVTDEDDSANNTASVEASNTPENTGQQNPNYDPRVETARIQNRLPDNPQNARNSNPDAMDRDQNDSTDIFA